MTCSQYLVGKQTGHNLIMSYRYPPFFDCLSHLSLNVLLTLDYGVHTIQLIITSLPTTKGLNPLSIANYCSIIIHLLSHYELYKQLWCSLTLL